MKLIYALPLAVAAAIAISGCSKESENSTSFTSPKAMPTPEALQAPAASSTVTVPAPSSTTSEPASGSTAQ